MWFKTSIFFILLLSFFENSGQNCSESLAKAREYYSDGKLHLISELLEPCLSLNNVSKDERVRMLRLLANTSFVTDSLLKGEGYVKQILNKNVSFKSTKEDVYLFRKSLIELRTRPNFQVGFNVGITYSNVAVKDIYDQIYDGDNAFLINGIPTSDLISNVSTNLRPNFGILFSKRLSNSSLKTNLLQKILTQLEVESGVRYLHTDYEYFDNFNRVTVKTEVVDIQVPLIFNYRIPLKSPGSTVYFQTGSNLSWLKSWTHVSDKSEGSSIDTKAIRTNFNYNIVAGAMVSVTLGKLVIKPSIQYWFGLSTRSKALPDSENAALLYNEPSFLNYNPRFSYFVLSVGVSKQFF